MDTLSTTAVKTLVDHLFLDAERADGPIRAELAGLSAKERAHFMDEAKRDYRAFYGRAKDLYLPVSRATGELLYLLARARHARRVVEFGTSFGISTVHLASAVRDNGGGCVIGSELLPEKAARARENLSRAGLADLVDVREGDALESLARDLPDTIDLVLLDGAKPLYVPVLDLLRPRLGPGTVLVADNADDAPDYLAIVRDRARGYASMPFADDVELTVVL